MKTRYLPQFPEHLNRLTQQPWSKEASAQVDRWLDYIATEFEGVRR